MGDAVAPIKRHHGFDIAAKIRRQAPGFAEEIVALHFEDGGNALHKIVARRSFLLAFDATLIGWRNPETLGEFVQAEALGVAVHANGLTEGHQIVLPVSKRRPMKPPLDRRTAVIPMDWTSY